MSRHASSSQTSGHVIGPQHQADEVAARAGSECECDEGDQVSAAGSRHVGVPCR